MAHNILNNLVLNIKVPNHKTKFLKTFKFNSSCLDNNKINKFVN